MKFAYAGGIHQNQAEKTPKAEFQRCPNHIYICPAPPADKTAIITATEHTQFLILIFCALNIFDILPMLWYHSPFTAFDDTKTNKFRIQYQY